MVFFAVILPFQFAWAGAGFYCQHETGQAAQHFGHHEHQHQGPGDQTKSDSGKLNVGGDNDCSSHLNGQGCFSSFSEALLNVPMAVFNDICPRRFTSHFPDGPERPDRQLAA